MIMAGILLEGENVSDEERAAHARKLSEANRQEALERLAKIKAEVGTRKLAEAERIPGTALQDQVVPAGDRSSLTLAAGHRLRIIDLEGRQAVDFLCYDQHNPENRYNAANTMKFNRSIFIGEGTRLYSDLGDVLMTVERDTVGYHDTIGGCCSSEANYLRYGIKDTPSCRTNFIAELARHGLGPRDLPANVNFFMYVPVREDGSTEIVEGMSLPGDYVDVRAERDVLVVISNCPQIFNPCNGWNPTPIRLIEWTQ
jgi:uncharacterized protein